MQDERTERDFTARSEEDQQAFIEQTWCDQCQQENLGMSNPREYLLKGIVFIEGDCNRCGGVVLTELTEDDF
ncbi:hypothetical protein [Amphritea balenae]|uniref:Uncharacterized protein n=1 Tax=Amphritea balenae TaxID=452629 RepID=A0A3P1SU23_9GAMM|nr:hypothetical protein [Amphritea balenae]RRD00590.1 hypothetical protein EHS89_05745 [Amphritea balenae]GGK69525.1 hypothetical protein GCM10007941_19630 [Amphritea balenae]